MNPLVLRAMRDAIVAADLANEVRWREFGNGAIGSLVLPWYRIAFPSLVDKAHAACRAAGLDDSLVLFEVSR